MSTVPRTKSQEHSRVASWVEAVVLCLRDGADLSVRHIHEWSKQITELACDQNNNAVNSVEIGLAPVSLPNILEARIQGEKCGCRMVFD